jgi:cytochrome c-type biogenesis protein CcmH/NrfG
MDVTVKQSDYGITAYAARAIAVFVRCLALVLLPVFNAVQAPRLAAPAQPSLSKPFHPQAGEQPHYTTRKLELQVCDRFLRSAPGTGVARI